MPNSGATVVPIGRRRRPGRQSAATTGDTFGAIKLADLVIPRLKDRFRYAPEMGWLAYSGAKWETEADDLVLREVVGTVKDYALRTIDERGLTQEACKELGLFSSGTCQTHAIRIARSADGIRTRLDRFDAEPVHGQPYRLHCANGITIEMHPEGGVTPRPTTPDDLNTKVACAYDPDAKAPKTSKAFKQYQPSDDIRRYMLQMWAKGLSGQGSNTFTAHIGGEKDSGVNRKGGNGKSTMMTAAGWVAGEYHATLPIEVILKTRRGTAREVFRSELADLRGARLVTAAEPEEGSTLAAGVIKDLTGGAPITGRRMRCDAMTFVPRMLLSFSSNNRPRWSADGGMERRYVEIAWLYEVPAEEQRESFMEELREESPGFLNAILKHWTGAGRVQPPPIIAQMTDAGAKSASPVYRFTVEALTRDDGATITAMSAFEAYGEWARQNEMRPVSSTKFGLEMARLGFERRKTRAANVYVDHRVEETYQPRR